MSRPQSERPSFVLIKTMPARCVSSPVDWIGLQSRDDGLERREVLENSELLRDVDPCGDGSRSVRHPHVVAHQDAADDAQRHGVELVHGGQDRGRVVVAALVTTRPDGTQALVRHKLLEQLLAGVVKVFNEFNM